jgi:hypothetical protein
MPRRHKGISAQEFASQAPHKLMPGVIMPQQFSAERWAKIAATLPDNIPAEARARLYEEIASCYSWLRARRRQEQAEISSGMAAKRYAKMAQRLHSVTEDYRAIMDADGLTERHAIPPTVRAPHGESVQDDISDLHQLTRIAADLSRRATLLNKLKRSDTDDAWPDFVNKVAQVCRRAGLPISYNNRGYEVAGAAPTRFMAFMWALQRHLLGRDGRPAKKPAFRASIVKALKSHRKRKL